MRVALDTNVLVYAEGVNGAIKYFVAVNIIRTFPNRSIILPAQVLAELFNVLVRKGGHSRSEARRVLLTWHDALVTTDTTSTSLFSAVDLASTHQVSIWDALILAVAAEAECRLLLSEDMHEGFTWRGVTVVNPFAPTRHPLLEIALNSV